MLSPNLHQVRHYWILLLVLGFGALSIYTSQPSYGAPNLTPTPDVNTVPKPQLMATATYTPFPTPTVINDSGNSDNGGGAIATPQPPRQDNDDDNNDNDGDSNNTTNNSAAPNVSADAPTTAPQTAVLTATTNITGVVTAVTLNLRKGPSTTTRVLDTLFLNDRVQILGRDPAGAWWYICCGARTQQAGWVSRQYIALAGNSSVTEASVPITGNTPAQGAVATDPNLAAGLVLELRPQPAVAWQGARIDLQFVVHNRNGQPLTNVELRNDLPDQFDLVTTQISRQGQINYSGSRQGGPTFTITWPTVPANGSVTATVTVQVAPNTPDGTLIDNLAMVNSAEGAQALAGITLAMPPVTLPQFR